MQKSAWQRIELARMPERPGAKMFIEALFSRFNELSGDRMGFDDNALIGGLAEFNGETVVVLGQEKGKNTEERLKRNFGYMHPEGYRKALRLMRLAEKFSFPLITLIDTPGAYPGLEAEQRGQAHAIAENLKVMARLKTPILSLVLGEGASGGAIGIGLADHIAMFENAYYSVITPEGCASILWGDPSKRKEATEALKITSYELKEKRIIDAVLPEPEGGAHKNPELCYTTAANHLKTEIAALQTKSIESLLEARYQKFRAL